MKIAGINFPSPLLSALRDGELVIFAGAGVSMGEPACLPSFKTLAEKIAQGTGEVLQDGEEDRFLGRLHDKGVKVHERAVRELSRNNPKPTALHKNLLRLHQKSEQVRVVTTNFDLLFEEAAQDVFGTVPKVSQAPELPQAQNFYGIAHIHGDLNHPQGLVLTDKDFGAAYMNKGWGAKDFLVELFGHFTVLFVGYSHNDIILNYLARGLLVDSTKPRRFALTDDSDLQRWESLGIEPFLYPKPDANDHSRLYEGVRRLADRANFSISDWQREITEIAEKSPLSLDEEAANLIDDSLSYAERTRFFTQAATSPEWIDWLSRRGHLAPLFGTDDLSEQAKTLAIWLADMFACNHADALFSLIARHQSSSNLMQLNPHFWSSLQTAIGHETLSSLDKDTLCRWISLLIATAPKSISPSFWLLVTRRCIEKNMVSSLLQIFDSMAGYCLSFKLLSDQYKRAYVDTWQDGAGNLNYKSFNDLWEKGLKPNLSEVAEPLLSLIVRHIEDHHRTLCVWGQADNKRNPISDYRWFIAPHEQNRRPQTTDVLIDAVRDCLEQLAVDRPDEAARWCDHFIDSDTPLLRCLAIHILFVRCDLSPEAKIDWLLKHSDLRDEATHNENSRIVQQTYPKVSIERREKLIDAALDRRWLKEESTARRCFYWLHWLYHKVDPSCSLAKTKLDEVRTQYPDFIHSSEETEYQSPWSVEILLAHPADEWLEKSSLPESEEDRYDLLTTIQDTVREKLDWGLDLADALAAREDWNTDLWHVLIQVWAEEIGENRSSEVFHRLQNANLYQKHSIGVANILCALVKDGGIPCALELLPQANKIAVALWANLDPDYPYQKRSDWLESAINHPAGTLARFWLKSLFLWWKHQDPAPEQLNSDYLAALSKIVKDRTIAGRLGKSVLAGYFASLLEIDESWTKENLLPLFFRKNHSNADDYNAIWDGFLTWRRLTPSVAELLSEAFLDAVQHINRDLSGQKRLNRFIDCYTVMLVYFALDAIEKWIPEFFAHSDVKARHTFANEIGHRLDSMNETQQQEQWNHWLKSYWQDRLDGVPKPLESDEIKRMMDWLPHLTGVFPEAVDLAIQMPQSESGGQRASLAIYDLEGSDLPEMYPEAMAKLVLYIRPSLPLTDLAYGHQKQVQRELIAKLLQSPLSPDLKTKLQELDAKLTN